MSKPKFYVVSFEGKELYTLSMGDTPVEALLLAMHDEGIDVTKTQEIGVWEAQDFLNDPSSEPLGHYRWNGDEQEVEQYQQ